MSLRSLARQGKTLHRHTKPKPRKPVEKLAPFDVHAFAKTATDALESSPTIKTRGAFGGCTVTERLRRQAERARWKKALRSP